MAENLRLHRLSSFHVEVITVQRTAQVCHWASLPPGICFRLALSSNNGGKLLRRELLGGQCQALTLEGRKIRDFFWHS